MYGFLGAQLRSSQLVKNIYFNTKKINFFTRCAISHHENSVSHATIDYQVRNHRKKTTKIAQ